MFKIWLKYIRFESIKNTSSDIAGGLDDARGS